MANAQTSAPRRGIPSSESGPSGALRANAQVAVLLPLPLSGAYHYLAPPDLDLAPGDIVRVPLGGREVAGVVWEPDAAAPAVPPDKLKAVALRYDVPALPPVQRRFVEWVAGYTMSARGAVLRMALSVPGALDPPRPATGYRLVPGAAEHAGVRLTPARRRVLAELANGPARPLAELSRAAGVTPGVVKGLQAAGVLETVSLPNAPSFAAPDPERPGPPLSPDQAAAAAALSARARDGGFSVTLLDGVTGSGKTEVYLEAVAAALGAGRQVLVLLPEIALSAQWLERFAARFGVRPATWHSEMTAAQRRATWRAIAFGEARIVVGARSALFLPYAELGLVVVDEEHDAAYKQEDGVIYHARDMAVVRGRLGEIPVVLVSATPSLETVVNLQSGRYRGLHLAQRHGGASLPEVSLVDLRRDPPPRIAGHGQSWLSGALRTAIREALAEGEQALLFLNRRGYAPLTLCRTCGHRLQCPRCTAWLVEHRLAARLQCHHCGYVAALPESCPECGQAGTLAACGPGVERLAEEAATLFPEARRAIMASDTLSGPSAAAELLQAVQDREVDLLIGTQIVAKGHHFPYLTLVGVVDADLGLFGGDLRAAERTYQLLHQVAGRAGRAAHAGRVLIQTAEPAHPVMQALAQGARDAFLAVEAETRERAGLPPFGRLAALILSGADAPAVEAAGTALARGAPRGEGVAVLGPAPAPLAVLRGRHRRRLLVKTRRDIAPQRLIQAWLARVDLPRGVRLQIDIDPYSFL